jgi:hypothetical protein
VDMAVRGSVLLCLVLLHCVTASAARVPNIRLPSQRRESGQDVPLNSQPLVGILSQPGDGMNHETKLTSSIFFTENTTSYIAASYVKFVESGGARAVPLIYNEPEETLRKVPPCPFSRFHVVGFLHQLFVSQALRFFSFCGFTEIRRHQWDSHTWRWHQLGRQPFLPYFREALKSTRSFPSHCRVFLFAILVGILHSVSE